MKYFINDELVSMKEFGQALETAVYNEVSEHFDDFLDEVYESVDLAGIKYDMSVLLYKVDPIRYDCMLSEEVDYRYTEYLNDFESETEDVIDGQVFRTEEETEED